MNSLNERSTKTKGYFGISVGVNDVVYVLLTVVSLPLSPTLSVPKGKGLHRMIDLLRKVT